MIQNFSCCALYRDADKSLARPGRESAASLKSVMGRGDGLIWLGYGQVVDSCGCGNEPQSSIKCGECSLFPSWSG